MMYSTTDGEKFFVKTSRKSSEQMFAGEAKGLQAMYGVVSFVPFQLFWKLGFSMPYPASTLFIYSCAPALRVQTEGPFRIPYVRLTCAMMLS